MRSAGRVVAIALVLAAGFIPTAFIPGISRCEFYRQFALTVAVSTLISALDSLTLSPALAAWLLKPEKSRRPPQSGGAGRKLDGLAVQQRLRRDFGFLCKVRRRNRAAQTRHSGDLRRSDRRHGVDRECRSPGLHPDPRPGIRYRRHTIARRLVALADGCCRPARIEDPAGKPGVQDAVAFAGFSGATFTNASNAAAIFARFRPFDERVANGLSASAIIGQLLGGCSRSRKPLSSRSLPRRCGV